MKTSSLVGLTSAGDDADDLAVAVEQRPAGVARVDRGIDLDQAVQHDAAVGRAGTSGRGRRRRRRSSSRQAERVADRERLAALADRCRVAERRGHDARRAARSRAGRRCRSRARVRRPRAGDCVPSANVTVDVGRVGDDVEAGQDVAVDVDHDAAARPPCSVPVWPSASVARSGRGRPTDDGLVDELGEGRRRCDRSEGLPDPGIDLLLGQGSWRREDEVVEDDRREGHGRADDVGCRPREPARSPRRSSVGLPSHVVHPLRGGQTESLAADPFHRVFVHRPAYGPFRRDALTLGSRIARPRSGPSRTRRRPSRHPRRRRGSG